MRLEIDKNVPVAGGMGGGSADAAATLLACDALWGTDLPEEELLDARRELGADVPFAFIGGTAIGTGRGDQLSPALGEGHVPLGARPRRVRPLDPGGLPRARSAPRRGTAQDIFRRPAQPAVDADVLQALRAGDPHMLAESLHNDLQAPALHLAPGLAGILELGEENGALAGMVSGSGPTVAFLAADVDAALELQIALSAARLTWCGPPAPCTAPACCIPEAASSGCTPVPAARAPAAGNRVEAHGTSPRRRVACTSSIRRASSSTRSPSGSTRATGSASSAATATASPRC